MNFVNHAHFFYYFRLFYLYFALNRAVPIMKNAQHSHATNLRYCMEKSERSYIFFTILGCTTVITCLTGNCPLWKMFSTATRPIWGTVQKIGVVTHFREPHIFISYNKQLTGKCLWRFLSLYKWSKLTKSQQIWRSHTIFWECLP